MAYYIHPSISSSLSEFVYQTEYQRSFPEQILRAERGKSAERSNITISKRREDEILQTNSQQEPRTKFCSVGIQTEEKRVTFNSKNQTNPYGSTTASQQQHEKTSDKIVNDMNKNALKKPILHYEETRQPTTYSPAKNAILHYKQGAYPTTNSSPKYNETPIIHGEEDLPPSTYIIDLVAGNNSNSFQRTPFIQSKKKVLGSPTTVLPNEPPLQKKKIIPYYKNHNILRTETLVEEKLKVKNDDKSVYPPQYIYQRLPDMYKSSYDREFEFRQPIISPVLLAESQLNASQEKENKNLGIKCSLTYCDETPHDKSNYESEYHRQFSSKRFENLYSCRSKDQFSNYYQEVLKKRQVAYKPFLAWVDRNKEELKRKENNESNDLEQKQSGIHTNTLIS